MTPEEAQDIYHAARVVAWNKHMIDNTPIIERNTEIAGFQAIIDAVESEMLTKCAEWYLARGEGIHYDFTGTRSHEKVDG